MKITNKILSIPPYISTTWANVASLQVTHEQNQSLLVITLTNHSSVKIPNLDQDTLQKIFLSHENSLEQNVISSEPTKPLIQPQHPLAVGSSGNIAMSFPFKFSEMETLGNIGSMSGFLQHSQEQANSPNLPEEFIAKIASVSKALGLNQQLENVAKAEPHCNCPYCQIARALHDEPTQTTSNVSPQEDPIDENDLKFREWDIVEKNRNLYEVSNPLDKSEHYQVFLGKPIGCTCGHKNCEHIKAVLNS